MYSDYDYLSLAFAPSFNVSSSSVPSAIQQAALLDEQARVEEILHRWNSKTEKLSPNMRKACKLYIKNLTDQLLNDLEGMSKGCEIEEFRSKVTGVLTQIELSMETYCSETLIRMHERQVTEQAHGAINRSLESLSAPFSGSTSQRPLSQSQGSVPIWQKVKANKALQSPSQETPSASLSFPEEPAALTKCLEGQLGPYLNEKGITRDFAEFFAGATLTPQEISLMVRMHLLLVHNDKLHPDSLTTISLHLEKSALRCAKEATPLTPTTQERALEELEELEALTSSLKRKTTNHLLNRWGHSQPATVTGLQAAEKEVNLEQPNPVRNYILSGVAHGAVAKLIESQVPGLGTIYLAGQVAQELDPHLDRFLKTASPDDFTPCLPLKGDYLDPLLLGLAQPDTAMCPDPILAARTLRLISQLLQAPTRAMKGIHKELVTAGCKTCDALGVTDKTVKEVAIEMLEAYAQVPTVMPDP